MKKLLSLLLCVTLVLSACVISVAAPADNSGDIVIIHTNDTHCNYTLFNKVATAAKDADLLVDAGDAIQGGIIGTLSKGTYITDIMNYLGYDVAIPGNHEFDYTMNGFFDIADKADFPYISCNFKDLRSGDLILPPFTTFEVKGKKIAFVGITTPYTLITSTPVYFQDENGNYIYSFSGEPKDGSAFYPAVQKAVDAARNDGADYVIALAHLGENVRTGEITSVSTIKNTRGIDILIDGHSHSTYTSTVTNLDGKEIPCQQTGTKLENVGRITIKADGTILCENIPLEGIEADPATTKFIETISAEFDDLQNTVVANTSVDLTIKDADGNRLVRSGETNLGDLCADAFRYSFGAEIGVVNGGGVRADIPAGEITYGQMVAVSPFDNTTCFVKLTGQQIADMLENSVKALPGESGGFLQVSGLTYTVNTAIDSPVVIGETGGCEKIEGQRRVSDIKVNGVALDLNKKYTVASTSYVLLDGGDGYTMLGENNVEILAKDASIDNQVIIAYIVDKLGGTVGSEYSSALGRITIINDPSAIQTEPPVIAPAEPVTPDKEDSDGIVYIVKKGDSLWKISANTYGNGIYWKNIFDVNKGTVKNPNKIYIGQQLVLPKAVK